jgi:hypothetical protein
MKEHEWIQRTSDVSVLIAGECKYCGLIRIRSTLIDKYVYGFAWKRTIVAYMDCEEARMRAALR